MHMLLAVLAACGTMDVCVAPAQALNGPHNGTYQASEVILDDLVGRADISVGGSQVTLAITGRPEELAAIEVQSSGGKLRILSHKRHRTINNPADYAQFKLSVPRGTNLSIDGMVGEIAAGDLASDISIDATALEGTFGAVRSVSADASGSLDLEFGDIAGKLSMDVSGSSDIKAKSAQSAALEISGSGKLQVGAVRQGLSASINGSGSVDAGSVNGPVSVDVSGSGAVHIAQGRADPLKVQISGQGEFSFGGEAVNPEIDVSGSGSVSIEKYTGKLKTRGGNITIGH